MEALGILLVVALAGLAALTQIRRDRRIDRAFTLGSLAALAGYLIAVAAGIAVVVLAIEGPQPEGVAAGAMLALLAWIGLAALWLIRLAPRLREPPGFLMRPWGVLDWALLAVVAGGGGYAILNGA